MKITSAVIPVMARRVVAPYNTMPELCTKPKAPSSRELSPQVTEGVFHPQVLCEFQDTTRQLRCHPPRRGGQIVNLPATMSWVDIVARKAIANSHKPHPLRTNRGLVGLHGKHQPFHIAERKATRYPQQLLNLPLRKERSEWSKNKVLCQAFFQESLPSETPRKK